MYDVIIATGYTNDSFKLNEEQGNLGLSIGDEQLSVKRLSQLRADANPERPRAILVQVASKSLRDSIVGCANTLKGKGPYKKVYLKKDIHPAIRKEEGRIRKRVYDEKNNPQNTGKVILYDRNKRVMLCDNVIIDRFGPNFL